MLRSFIQASRGLSTAGRAIIHELKNEHFFKAGDEKVVLGWVRRQRLMKKVSFLEVSDGSCSQTLQLVVPSKDLPPTVTVGSCVRAAGVLTDNPRNEELDLAVRQLEVVGRCDAAHHPLDELSHVDTERQWPHLRPQLPSFGALLRLRHGLEHSIRSVYHQLGFFGVHTPLLTRMDCEGGGETFCVTDGRRFFETDEEDIHLTVSSQLHLEAAMGGLGKVFTVSPAWRAEKSLTRHHLAEFYMIEAESVDAVCVESLCTEAETFLVSVAIAFMKSLSPRDLAVLEEKFKPTELSAMRRLEAFVSTPFVRITFKEALQVLLAHTGEFHDVVPTPSTVDFSKEQEFFLVKHFGDRPVFVTNFPADTKPMYCAIAADGTAEAVDLLLPMVGEALGGSVRENSLERLKERMHGVSTTLPQALEWYLDLRRFGSPPHGGYGIGFDRLLQFFIGVANIRDVVPFPRYYRSCRL